MFLFIFESISTTEVIIIGIIALIVFGPRKLPELGRKAGKLMAEFRSATNDFKSTWEREVAMSEEDPDNDMKKLAALEDLKPVENSIGRNSGVSDMNGADEPAQLEPPSVKEVEPALLQEAQPEAITEPEPVKETKKDWL